MISVLIPVYNYSIFDLVKTLHKQLIEAKTTFEIICIDDGSEKDFQIKNLNIKEFQNTTLIESTLNNGRVSTRQLLSEKAQYNWLLFLDADVLPKHDNFIANYLSYTTSGFNVIYGGFAYKKTAPESEYLLRWKYGRAKEELLAKERNKRPYKVVISANFLIKKNTFQQINSKITKNSYGLDNQFGSILKSNSTSVLHIDNEVYHLGIEKSSIYLSKKEEAADTLITLLKSGNIPEHDNSLLTLFTNLKAFKLHYLFSIFYKGTKHLMKNHLLGSYPSIIVLQLYRISYMCYRYLQKKNV